MKETFENLVLVCLDGDFCRSVSVELSDKLDMLFADLKGYIEYDLLDSKLIMDTCGLEYLKEREFKSAKNCAKFQNTILTTDFDLFKQNRKAFTKKSCIVYLKLSKRSINKNETINILSYQNRDEYLQQESDVIIEIKSKVKSKALKEIMIKLGEAL